MQFQSSGEYMLQGNSTKVSPKEVVMVALAVFLDSLMECATTPKNVNSTVCPFTQENVTQLNRCQHLGKIVIRRIVKNFSEL